MQLKPAITVETKTFNNHLGFERGFWQLQTMRFVVVPKRRFFGRVLHKNRKMLVKLFKFFTGRNRNLLNE
jgi:hypothetical protein